MTSFRHAIHTDYNEAAQAVRCGATDVAIVESTRRAGICTFYMIADVTPPTVLTDLPGYRSIGIQSCLGGPVCSYEVLRTSQEVVNALLSLMAKQESPDLSWLNPRL